MVATIARWAEARIPPGRLDERDPDFIRAALPMMWVAASIWFRADVQGLEHIPSAGPVLLIGNHSGGNMTPDTMVFTLAFCSYFGADRPFYQLAHNLVMLQPALRPLRRFGMMLASEAVAESALDRGAAVLIYPGGDWEVHRPSSQSAQVDFAGRSGFVRLALERRVPIVPVVSLGGQETAVFLSRGNRLASALGLDRLLRLKVMPVSLALPWGLDVGDFLGHIPLPSKLTVRVLDPIDLYERLGDHPDPAEAYRLVIAVMQSALDALSEARRLPVWG